MDDARLRAEENLDADYPSFKQACGLTLGWLALGIVVGIIAHIVSGLLDLLFSWGGAEQGPENQSNLWLDGSITLLATGILVRYALAKAGRPTRVVLPFRAVPMRWYFVSVPLAVGLLAFFSDVDNALRYVMPPPDFLVEIMSQVVAPSLGSLVVLVVVAPVTEELLFRGLIMHGFLQRFSPRRAIVLQALLFSLMHINPYQLFFAFIFGLAAGALRYRLGSLWPVMFMHAVTNGVVWLAVVSDPEIPGITPGAEVTFQPLWITAVGGGILAASIYTMAKLWRNADVNEASAG